MALQHHAPLHIQVGDALIQEIESGRYAVGSLLPPELELADRYAVSRHTIREATRFMGVVRGDVIPLKPADDR